MSSDWSNLALVVVALGACIATAALLRQKEILRGEASRKLVHSGMGSICAAFPWIFSSSGPVWALSAIAIGTLVICNRIRGLSVALRDIDRASEGEFYFPLGIALCFHFSSGQPELYCPPVLMLAYADALAALMGKRFGRARFTTGEGFKTWEGSLAFIIAASATTALALAFVSTLPLERILLAALLLGLVGAILEAAAWRGLDNLLLPTAGLFAMAAYIDLSTLQLLGRIVAIGLFAGVAFAVKRRSTLDDSALLGAALILYLAWALGGWSWALPPLLVLLLFPSVVEFDYDAFRDFQSVTSLLLINLVAFAWLAQSIRSETESALYWPYSGAYVIHLSLIWSRRARDQGWRLNLGASVALFSALATLAVQVLPFCLAMRFDLSAAHAAPVIATFAAALLGSAAVVAIDGRFSARAGLAKPEWLLHCALAALGSFAAYLAATQR